MHAVSWSCVRGKVGAGGGGCHGLYVRGAGGSTADWREGVSDSWSSTYSDMQADRWSRAQNVGAGGGMEGGGVQAVK
jgi:hypothetical protein